MTKEEKKPVSRQRRWQIKKQQEGKCSQCGQPREAIYSRHCVACAKKRSEQSRKEGHNAWTEGKVGRPPKWAKKGMQ